jgi:hypothetical protein
MKMNQIAMMGHNKPPSETEILKERLSGYEDIPKRLTVLKTTELPAIINDDMEAAKAADYLGSIKNFFEEVDKIFVKEKAPFWDAGKAADAWKNSYKLETSTLTAKAEKILLVWNQKKRKDEEDRQAEIAKKAREDAESLAQQAVVHESEGIQDTAEELMNMALNAEQKAEKIEAGGFSIKSTSRGTFSSSSLKTETVGRIESISTIDLNALKGHFKESEIQDAINRSIKAGVTGIAGVIYSQEDKLTTRRI